MINKQQSTDYCNLNQIASRPFDTYINRKWKVSQILTKRKTTIAIITSEKTTTRAVATAHNRHKATSKITSSSEIMIISSSGPRLQRALAILALVLRKKRRHPLNSNKDRVVAKIIKPAKITRIITRIKTSSSSSSSKDPRQPSLQLSRRRPRVDLVVEA